MNPVVSSLPPGENTFQGSTVHIGDSVPVSTKEIPQESRSSAKRLTGDIAIPRIVDITNSRVSPLPSIRLIAALEHGMFNSLDAYLLHESM